MKYWAKLFFSDWRKHFSAICEVLSIAIITIAPIVISFFSHIALNPDNNLSFLRDLTGRGQFYLLGYSSFGTIVWLAFLKGDKARHDVRTFFGAVASLFMLPVIGFMSVDPTFSTMRNPLVIHYSYVFYGALLTINYFLIVFVNIDPPEPSKILSDGASEMREKYKEISPK